MNADSSKNGLLADKTEKIIKCFYNVYNTLGYGFLEKVYKNAMCIELKEAGFEVDCEYPITVYYKGHNIGDYKSDILTDKEIFLELKAGECLVQADENQLINYLRSTEIEVGLVLGFCKKPEIRRKIFSNKYKSLK